MRESSEKIATDEARARYLTAARRLITLQGQVAALGLPLDPGRNLNRVHWTKEQAALAIEFANAWTDVVETRKLYDKAWSRSAKDDG